VAPEAALVARFTADLDRLIAPGEPLGLAVSGGPDSVALLLLAAAARPGSVRAATVDHGLRAEAAAEAAFVADLCRRLGVPHSILKVEWPHPPDSAVQERARDARYARLASWMRGSGLAALATGHHRDDQAETVLMRLGRGAGVRGLAGMRASSAVPGDRDLRLLRPLLGWSRDELASVCSAAGVEPIRDPGNDDPRFERVRTRQTLASGLLDPQALARSAANLAEADEALDWAAAQEWDARVKRRAGEIVYGPELAPMEIRRRIAGRAVRELGSEGGGQELRGRELDRLMDALDAGRSATVRGVLCSGGVEWRFAVAPRRRS